MRAGHILILLATLLVLGCSSHEELPPPDNPFDPGNPNYESPYAYVSSRQVEGQTIQESATLLEWTGNESASEYAFRTDSGEWSTWTELRFYEWEYLDEGPHTFEVKARSINGDEQEVPFVAEFIVDAMQGPTALVYPFLQTGSVGDTIAFHIVAEEVVDLFALECRIQLDDRLELLSVSIEGLLDEWGGFPLTVIETQPDAIDIAISSADGVNNTFTGSAQFVTILAEIKSGAAGSGLINAVLISDVVYLNPDLEGTILENGFMRVGVVDVQ